MLLGMDCRLLDDIVNETWLLKDAVRKISGFV